MTAVVFIGMVISSAACAVSAAVAVFAVIALLGAVINRIEGKR